MKKKVIFFFLLFLSINPVLISTAHSGGTDSDGGHYNSSTDEYHYHHGYEAHYHINGQCPYEDIINYDNDYSSVDEDHSVNYAKIEKEKDSVFSSIVDFIKSSDILSTLVIAILFYATIFAIMWIKEWINGLIYAHKLKKQREQKREEEN